jgi:hypothetical protein
VNCPVARPKTPSPFSPVTFDPLGNAKQVLPHHNRVGHAAEGSREPLGKVIGPVGAANSTPLDESGETWLQSLKHDCPRGDWVLMLRALLTGGLGVAVVGNLLFWAVARATLPYSVFVIGMLVAGTAAGVLNGETVKVLQSAVPEDRAGMASGIASTTRFIGILLSVATLGAVLSNVARNVFVATAVVAGLEPTVAEVAAKRITSGDLPGMLSVVPPALQARLHQAGLAAYGDGFAAAALLATALAALACALTLLFVQADDTAPLPVSSMDKTPCMVVDCRHPL